MKQEIFEKIVEEQIKKIKETLLEKQKQYATVDRLHIGIFNSFKSGYQRRFRSINLAYNRNKRRIKK